ncbi:UDP-2,4-diacetamido-2,4,6-trideoxy-beta-L-altropyranose hydrolase [Acidovorax sp. NPDC077664]|uniref:UDP-2,4-diacetamido-2,4, 6-trideoxy-beta-L-altropyranose hydrolase n=2 Tax=unclassified Acidovorax TaxID=2684926 RepID=UPI003D02CA8D
MMRRIAFRVDASPVAGQGHLSRCLALASRLHARDTQCHFVGTHALAPWVADIETAGHRVSLIREDLAASEDAVETIRVLEGPADWLVVDHYGLDACWHKVVRPSAPRLLVIDDLANRPLAADAVLDPSPCADMQAYRKLAPAAKLLLGPSWCLLRKEFAEARRRAPHKETPDFSPRIHLALGGTDYANATVPLARGLLEWFEGVRIMAVLGHEGPQAAALRELATTSNGRLELVVATREVAATMAVCNCAVGAPGGTLWERFCMGLPTACVSTAPTQRPVIERLAHAGWLLDLGEASDFGKGTREALARWLSSPAALYAQRERLVEAVDGLGADRLVDWLVERAR